jgi:hypothetical protein
MVSRVPSGLRIPDGETGDRANWISFQLQKFLQLPWLVQRDRWVPRRGGTMSRCRSCGWPTGVDPAEVRWPDLGYADACLRSYEIFAALREQGVIRVGVRFQVEYPTVLASISDCIVPEQQQALLGSCERAVFAGLGRLLAAISHDEVAVQWDAAVEFAILEESFASGGSHVFDVITAALARCMGQVPAEIPAGLQLLRGLRPPAFRAARIAGPAGPAAERGRRGGRPWFVSMLIRGGGVPVMVSHVGGRAVPAIRVEGGQGLTLMGLPPGCRPEGRSGLDKVTFSS